MVLNKIKERISDREYRLLVLFLLILSIFTYGKIIQARIIKKEKLEMEIVAMEKLIEDNHKKSIHFENLNFELLSLDKILNDKEFDYSLIKNQNTLIEYLENIVGPSFILENINTDYIERSLYGLAIDLMEIDIGFKLNYEGLISLINKSDFNNKKILLNDINFHKEDGFIIARMNMNILLDKRSEKLIYREFKDPNLVKIKDPFEIMEEEDSGELVFDGEGESTNSQNIEERFLEVVDIRNIEENKVPEKRLEVKNDVKIYSLELSKVITSHDNIWINYRKYLDNKTNINRLEYEFRSNEKDNIIHCELKDSISVEDKIEVGYLILDTYGSMPIEINILYRNNKGELMSS